MGGDRLGQATECITPSLPKVGLQLTENGASTSEVETQGWLPHPNFPSLWALRFKHFSLSLYTPISTPSSVP